ncbi:MAG: PhoH family protein [Clostridia bacterium]|nr:PhoH family protein [Clostridia bacterium]
MAGEETRIVKTETAEMTARIFGSYDKNAQAVEDAFSVRIHNRASGNGDAIVISGTETESVNRAAKAISYLLEIARRDEQVSDQQTAYIISTLLSGNDEELTGYGDDCICVTAKGKPIKAKTAGQQKYTEKMKKNTIVFGVGPAGTGKTFLAVAMAVKALREKQVSRIILTRPAIEAGEKLGFLPGDLQSKIDPYLRPLYDALYEMLGVENYQRLAEKQVIEIAPLAYMRGRTLDDSFIILDEAQNATVEQMKMFLTRLGFGSKAVITGDPSQTDLPYGQKSGLQDATQILDGIEDIAIHRFTDRDVVRHKLVQAIILAYEARDRRHDEQKDAQRESQGVGNRGASEPRDKRHGGDRRQK